MIEKSKVIELDNVVVRFAGDSGDGMQLTGNLFSTLSAILGNDISTFPDYPAEIRAPQGTISGVSGFQVHIGAKKIHTPGDKADVLVAMNPAALKTYAKQLKRNSVIIIDTDSFKETDLKKALFKTDNPFEELGLKSVQIIDVAISSMCKDSLTESGLDHKSVLRTKNMFALGLVCWLFNKPLDHVMNLLTTKFSKKEAVLKANIKVLTDGYNYGNNTHSSISTYLVEAKENKAKGFYTDVDGNTATAYGLMAAAEKSGLQLFLGSYPITPATDILHELAKHKNLGVKTVQAEDEIAGICTAIGASFAGSLAVTTTSGPGLCLKSEAIGLAVMTELPLVIVDVQRGGPSTGMPTKSEQTDLFQALYGRNGESPVAVLAASSPSNCFEAAYMASKIAVEHMTPVILLTDGYIANGTEAWKIPSLKEYPSIRPNYITPEVENWKPYMRNEDLVRYWAVPGTVGRQHRVGGLEKDYTTSAISTNAANHQKMTITRQEKIDKIANSIPELEIRGDKDAELLVIGWGGTYGHLSEAIEEIQKDGKKIAMAHFHYINPLPKNTATLLSQYKKIVVCEQNLGQFAGYLRMKILNIQLTQYNKIEGQPFVVKDLVEHFNELIAAK